MWSSCGICSALRSTAHLRRTDSFFEDCLVFSCSSYFVPFMVHYLAHNSSVLGPIMRSTRVLLVQDMARRYTFDLGTILCSLRINKFFSIPDVSSNYLTCGVMRTVGYTACVNFIHTAVCSLWLIPTDALSSNFITGITTLHDSGSISAHHQELLAVQRHWYNFCSFGDCVLLGAWSCAW
jgi:hypothetical protein